MFTSLLVHLYLYNLPALCLRLHLPLPVPLLLSLSNDEKSTLHLGWNVLNSIAGQFNTNALNALRAHEDVKYIQESTCRLSYLPPPVLTVPFLSSQASPCVSSTSFVKSTHFGV